MIPNGVDTERFRPPTARNANEPDTASTSARANLCGSPSDASCGRRTSVLSSGAAQTTPERSFY